MLIADLTALAMAARQVAKKAIEESSRSLKYTARTSSILNGSHSTSSNRKTSPILKRTYSTKTAPIPSQTSSRPKSISEDGTDSEVFASKDGKIEPNVATKSTKPKSLKPDPATQSTEKLNSDVFGGSKDQNRQAEEDLHKTKV